MNEILTDNLPHLNGRRRNEHKPFSITDHSGFLELALGGHWEQLHDRFFDFGKESASTGDGLSLQAHLWGFHFPIARHGSPSQKSKFSFREILGAHAVTEPEGGGNLGEIQTRAKANEKGFSLSGEKCFVTNGTHANHALVYALLEEKLTVFIVALDSKGVSRVPLTDGLGMKEADLCDLVFDNVQIPDESVLGSVGSGPLLFQQGIALERAFVASMLSGRISRIRETLSLQLRQKKINGAPALKNGMVQRRYTEVISHEHCSKLLARETARNISASATWYSNAALAKLNASESLVKTAQIALELFGAREYFSKDGIQKELRDAEASLFYSGTSDLLREFVARTNPLANL